MSLAAQVTDEVRRRMTAHHLSQTALARAAGIAPTLLHRTMSGDRHLTIDELGAVADVLGVTPEYLIRIARTQAPSDG